MKKVLIIYRFLPQYRVDFYNGLKKSLEEKGIELQLIYGKTNKVDALRNDEVDIDWADYIPNKLYKIGRFEILWQPCLKHIRGNDLIIVEGANRLVINYYLMLRRYFSRQKLGIWGHGRNLQLKSDDLRNKFKSIFLKQCDRYFAYTEFVKRYLLENKFPEKKITIVQNAIDTVDLKKQYNILAASVINELKTELGVHNSIIGLYCGAMYPDKRIPEIIEICKQIKEKVHNFHMIFIGSGIDSYLVKEASENYNWLHYVGPKFGVDRVKYFKISSIQIMPGAVGLGILDSFALETPLITTNDLFHGPEIEYIENGINGVITEDDFDIFTLKTIDILKSGKYKDLIKGCAISSDKYTIENMVSNFTEGIIECIND